MPLKHLLRRSLPGPALPLVKTLYYAAFRWTLRPRCLLAGLRERVDPSWRKPFRHLAGRRLPPPLLRYRVGEDLNPAMFVAIGRRITGDLERCLAAQGSSLATCTDVLDFGCGCGRTLLQLVDRFPAHRFSGTDIDAQAIEWCRQSLQPARFQVNRPEPPLDIAPGSFDLIYAISIFTHLDRRRQEHWIPEFHRLLRPGGALIVTVHGQAAAKRAGIVWAELGDLREQGVAFLASTKNAGIHPEWYQTSFNDRAYTERAFGRYFTGLCYLSGVFGFQDAIVCRKPQPG